MSADVNGPACAYCGQRYDFANRPVGIENCCPDCLPRPTKTLRTVVLEIVPRLRHRKPPLNPWQESQDRVAEIMAMGQADVDRLTSELHRMEPERRRTEWTDPLQRHLLCSATGLHDPNREGVCRDCELAVTDEPICRSEL